MGAKVAARIAKAFSKDRFDREISGEEIKAALADEIAAILKPREKVVDFAEGPRPRIVLFVGVNGSGKTTTIGKIAAKLSAQGADIVLAAGDTFRAAAVEQLQDLGRARQCALRLEAARRRCRGPCLRGGGTGEEGKPRPRADRHCRPAAEQDAADGRTCQGRPRHPQDRSHARRTT